MGYLECRGSYPEALQTLPDCLGCFPASSSIPTSTGVSSLGCCFRLASPLFLLSPHLRGTLNITLASVYPASVTSSKAVSRICQPSMSLQPQLLHTRSLLSCQLLPASCKLYPRLCVSPFSSCHFLCLASFCIILFSISG